jgi:hypothetical protein
MQRKLALEGRNFYVLIRVSLTTREEDCWTSQLSGTSYGGLLSDCLLFEASDLCRQLEGGGLPHPVLPGTVW